MKYLSIIVILIFDAYAIRLEIGKVHFSNFQANPYERNWVRTFMQTDEICPTTNDEVHRGKYDANFYVWTEVVEVNTFADVINVPL